MKQLLTRFFGLWVTIEQILYPTSNWDMSYYLYDSGVMAQTLVMLLDFSYLDSMHCIFFWGFSWGDSLCCLTPCCIVWHTRKYVLEIGTDWDRVWRVAQDNSSTYIQMGDAVTCCNGACFHTWLNYFPKELLLIEIPFSCSMLCHCHTSVAFGCDSLLL